MHCIDVLLVVVLYVEDILNLLVHDNLLHNSGTIRCGTHWHVYICELVYNWYIMNNGKQTKKVYHLQNWSSAKQKGPYILFFRLLHCNFANYRLFWFVYHYLCIDKSKKLVLLCIKKKIVITSHPYW